MKQKRARLIYNPTSGQEIMKKNVAIAMGTATGSVFLNMWSHELVTAIKLGWITAGCLIIIAIALDFALNKNSFK